MKFIFLFVILSAPAFSLSDGFLRMKPDPAYMQFLMTKYLNWHQAKFGFPILTPLEKKLTGKMDHWLVGDSQELYQLSLGHREEREGKKILSFRIWIHPEHRKEKELSGNGIPPGSEPWFFERNSENKICLIFKVRKATFESWCRVSGQKLWSWHHREKIVDEHKQWKNPFPLQLPTEIHLENKNGDVIGVSYHKALTHVSRVPKTLLQAVAVHTLESPFSMERYLIEEDGTMTIYYP